MTTLTCRPRMAALAAALLAAAVAAPASANIAVTQISSDPFTNSTSQHRTEVEPDTFSDHGTTIAAFQVGRFFNGGASDIGWTRSAGGSTSAGFLPGLTANGASPNSSFERVSDASVAYDAKHGVWLISSIPLEFTTLRVPNIFVSRSTDDGRRWRSPVAIPAPAVSDQKVDLDKNWTVCDTHPASPHYGNCYTEFDNFGQNDLEYMSTSTDGGATWSVPAHPAGSPAGIGGQPVVQPDGTVVVPFASLDGKLSAFRSTDGGATWSKPVTVDTVKSHAVAGGLRTSFLPSAEIASDGTVYVAWQDCRFHKNCSANDIVFSKSADGATWSPTTRIPIDSPTSTADHFIPGLAVDPTTSGSSTHLALTYYAYPDAACTVATCVLQAGTISSPDGGASWGGKDTIGPSMTLDQIANTSQGPMVGDYISTSFLADGTYSTAVPIGTAPSGDFTFDEGVYAPAAPIAVATTGLTPAATAGAFAVTGQGTGETHHALRRN